jgi:hypothetical protein
MSVNLYSIAPGSSFQVATSVTSAATAPITARSVMLTCTVGTFVRVGSPDGATPTALADGTDAYIAPNEAYFLRITPGCRLAFILPTGTGVAYVTPGAMNV